MILEVLSTAMIIGKVQITPKVIQIEYLNNNQEIIIIDVPTTEK
jgi:hypothetical protein